MEVNVNNHTPHHPAATMKPLNTSKKKKATPKIPKTHNPPSVRFIFFTKKYLLVEITFNFILLYSFHFRKFDEFLKI